MTVLLFAGLLVVVIQRSKRARNEHKELLRRIQRLERQLEEQSQPRNQTASMAAEPAPRPSSATLVPEPAAERFAAPLPEPQPEATAAAMAAALEPPHLATAAVTAAALAAAGHGDAAPASQPSPARQTRDAAPTIAPLPSEPEPAIATARHATPFRGVEQTLGLRWLTWIGVALLFLGIAFFLKYAYDRDWLGNLFGPRARIATATTFAVALGIAGWRSLARGMSALGQGLLGGGQALLYLSTYAAYQPAMLVVSEPLLSPAAAFLLLAAVTALGLALAVRLNAFAMAMIAVLGGFATPVLASQGADARDALCTYLLVLDLGVLGVARYCNWRALDLLAFAGTAALFSGWWQQWGEAHPQPDATCAWLAVFHLLFAVLPFVRHWRLSLPIPGERFALALANVAASYAFANTLLLDTANGLLAASCLCMTVFNAAFGVHTARRIPGDKRARDGFLLLGATLLTLALFHWLPAEVLASAWVVESIALLALGYRFAHPPTRLAAHAVLLLAVVRTWAGALPVAADDYWFLWNAPCLSLLLAGSGLLAFGWLHRRFGTASPATALARTCGIAGCWWILAVLSLEVVSWQSGSATQLWGTRFVAIAWLQFAGALAMLSYCARRPSIAVRNGAFLPWFCGVIATGIAYESYPADAWPVVNAYFAAGSGALLVLAHAAWIRRRDATATGLLGALQLAATGLATLETFAFLQRGAEAPTTATLSYATGFVWVALAGGSLLVAHAVRSRSTAVLALVPLALAANAAGRLYLEVALPMPLVANARFLLAVLATASLAFLRAALRRSGAGKSADPVAALALLGAYAATTAEAVRFTLAHAAPAQLPGQFVVTAALAALLCTTGARFRALATQNTWLRTAGLLLLVAAAGLGLAIYASGWQVGWMFANTRFALIAATVAATLLWRRGSALAGLGLAAVLLAFVGITLEPPIWLLAHTADVAEGERLALFSVTVTWLVGAIAALVTGFRCDHRRTRVAALVLFSVVAIKLLLLDMSGAQQLYRILAFVLVGLVFVSVSWIYHRVERRDAQH